MVRDEPADPHKIAALPKRRNRPPDWILERGGEVSEEAVARVGTRVESMKAAFFASLLADSTPVIGIPGLSRDTLRTGNGSSTAR